MRTPHATSSSGLAKKAYEQVVDAKVDPTLESAACSFPANKHGDSGLISRLPYSQHKAHPV